MHPKVAHGQHAQENGAEQRRDEYDGPNRLPHEGRQDEEPRRKEQNAPQGCFGTGERGVTMVWNSCSYDIHRG